jgi:hypothetical protein
MRIALELRDARRPGLPDPKRVVAARRQDTAIRQQPDRMGGTHMGREELFTTSAPLVIVSESMR